MSVERDHHLAVITGMTGVALRTNRKLKSFRTRVAQLYSVIATLLNLERLLKF